MKMQGNKNGKMNKETAADIVKDVLAWFVVTGVAFLYFMAMLLLGSLFLLNVWHTSFDEILDIGVILTVITSVVYFINRICKRLREK